MNQSSNNGSGAGVVRALRLLREYRASPKFSNDHAAIKRTVALEDEIDALPANLGGTIESAMALPGKLRELAGFASREAASNNLSDAIKTALRAESITYRQAARMVEAIFGPAPPATDAPELDFALIAKMLAEPEAYKRESVMEQIAALNAADNAAASRIRTRTK